MNYKFIRLGLALCLFPAAALAAGKTIRVNETGKPVRLEPGDTLVHPASGYRLKYNGHETVRSECAMPGKNCGFAYFPGERAQPLLEINKDDKCRTAPQPRSCEITYEQLSGQATGYLEVRLVSVFSFCERETNFDNRNSCYINAVKGGPNMPEYPAYAPENCERIKDSPEHKDACYEAVADKLGDARVCQKMKGAPGFQCVLLQAQAAGDPAVCDTLRRNRFHHKEQDRLDQIASCRNAVKASGAPGGLPDRPSQVAPSQDCAALEKQYAEVYQHLNTSCREHADCVLGSYDWDPCRIQAVSRKQVIDNILDSRSELHRLCGYVVKPCPAPVEPVFCVKSRCSLQSEVQRRYAKLRFRVPGVQNGEFTLMADTGIRCEAAPCPASREVLKGVIKEHRFTLPLKMFLEVGSGAPDPVLGSGPGAGSGRMWFDIGGKMAGFDARAHLRNPGREIVLGF